MDQTKSDLSNVARELRQISLEEQGKGGVSLEELEQLNEVFSTLEKGESLTDTTLRKVAEVKEEEAESGDIRALLRDMGIPQKVKLAMFGNATCRMLLITDSNRMVQEAVLKNPQIQEREICDYAKNTTVSDNVLRRISDDKSWMKSYIIKVNLVSNPKTPQDVALKWLRYLRRNDLKKIASSKNIPQTIAVAAKKKIADMQKRA